ncbi:polynucleotide adenylyltransferase PcnB [Ignatzschineria rhizosphaerae]|uniref:Poly(A) polymerase I n=1 Tax=Ignatzschineria rhizosphaerae TaxID=2923279 RepID=A0ABY3X0E0_9GAMM|nr:polynucleotide adenylyltransferase PcnB [Ignatzschineria rhizosphaerae]UNM95335.1 polynucleotide adenylyltransferase PcnB [Ignatzschineria rhizosphaerae]
MNPKIYHSKDHSIRNRQISRNSLTVINKLNSAGFNAYLVGGGVRDLLLGLAPKDFDIVTDAHPSEIRKVFRNSRIIGRRFRLVHVVFGREIIEVATFRSNDAGDKSKHYQTNDDGFVTRDNIYGTIDEDAMRRDFTVNALFYDVRDQTIIDYCGGYQDLQNQTLRLIGDPTDRFMEDPVRILRAVRFQAKLGFKIDQALLPPIAEHRQLLESVSPARMYDEVLKLFLTGHGEKSYHSMMEHELFGILFPLTYKALKAQGFPDEHLLLKSLKNSDARAKQGLTSSPYFVYASLLWAPFMERFESLVAGGMRYSDASKMAIDDAFKVQHQITVIPRYVREFIEDLWVFQFRLQAKVIRSPKRLMEHPRFKAAYDFLLLRAEANEDTDVLEKAQYWATQFAEYEAILAEQEREENRQERREGKQEVRREVTRHQKNRDEKQGDDSQKRRRRPRRRRVARKSSDA